MHEGGYYSDWRLLLQQACSEGLAIICEAVDEKDAELATWYAFGKYVDFVLGIC